MNVFTHHSDCPRGQSDKGKCICERPRYLKALAIGAPLAALEHFAGSHAGSETLHADAWHLVGDVVHDIWAWIIATLAIAHPHIGHHIRRYGGYIQAGLLASSGIIILLHLRLLQITEGANGGTVAGMGAVALIGNWMRFKILHPEGGIFVLFKNVARALRARSRELPTYLGEVLHVASDLLVSLGAMVAGVIMVVTGQSHFDEAVAVAIAAFLFASATLTLKFSFSHHH